MPNLKRTVSQIAAEIYIAWTSPNYGAVPYLEAMLSMNYVEVEGRRYGVEPAESIIARFLSNASSFRGADARRLKAELRARVAGYDCKACETRRSRGFEGKCPSCANERARDSPESGNQ